MHVNKRTGKIPFHAVSENLLGLLFACLQPDLLSKFNRVSVYEYNQIKYLLVGSLYFVAHHCESMFNFEHAQTDEY